MTILTENPHAGSFLLAIDDEGNLSRDNIVVASGAGVLQPGAVLGKITASGKFTLRDAAASDGSQTAAAILYDRVDATSADAKAVAVARHAEVRGSALIWKSSDTAAQKTAGLASLANAMIIAR
ncbi:Bacteriophage lambda head decoration protein D [Rhodoblastus acidophilus]|uniref:Bacteriophage lambda head decoration protein D n=1 Tax=Rhodoblastus acidophilus TaxID=1074 RepID=A0A212SEZ5_RHOAC|nr:head decoration protein [Rhodoblastus acidophilus]MCW2319240.1 hypothetical protein [Rhodoblastus acidophilus]PPQ37083.1 head decoration protein [Rhodoblastus acidophilus]RAI16732.1 head decoration protein [Rhodoblastus acidophilus]SNB84206.1 Bacteriophage lambda head decoration protein D [Rhodoblastus acidophilus]